MHTNDAPRGDVLIIGAGLAGLTAALSLPPCWTRPTASNPTCRTRSSQALVCATNTQCAPSSCKRQPPSNGCAHWVCRSTQWQAATHCTLGAKAVINTGASRTSRTIPDRPCMPPSCAPRASAITSRSGKGIPRSNCLHRRPQRVPEPGTCAAPLQQLMHSAAGIERNASHLLQAQQQLRIWKHDADRSPEMRNAIITSELIVQAASRRSHNAGTHLRSDLQPG